MPCVTIFGGIAFANALLFLRDKCPEFITLNMLEGQIVHVRSRRAAHLSPAITSSRRIVSRFTSVMRSTLRMLTPSTSSFRNVDGFVQRDAHLVKRRYMRFREGLAALRAAETLKAIAVLPKAINALNGHYPVSCPSPDVIGMH